MTTGFLACCTLRMMRRWGGTMATSKTRCWTTSWIGPRSNRMPPKRRHSGNKRCSGRQRKPTPSRWRTILMPMVLGPNVKGFKFPHLEWFSFRDRPGWKRNEKIGAPLMATVHGAALVDADSHSPGGVRRDFRHDADFAGRCGGGVCHRKSGRVGDRSGGIWAWTSPFMCNMASGFGACCTAIWGGRFSSKSRFWRFSCRNLSTR